MTDRQPTPPPSPPPAPPASWPDSLLALLEEQQALTHELTELAAGQSELIASGRTEALLGLLARRQRLVDQFVSGQSALARLAAELESRADELVDDQRDRIRSLLDEVAAGLANVMQQDEQDQKHLEAEREGRGRQLADVDVGKSARDAYLKSRAVINRFADRKG